MTTLMSHPIVAGIGSLFQEFDRECPEWCKGTVVLTKENGDLAGYGKVDRETGTFEITSDPQGVQFLS